jgi:hypothetical protein
LFKHSAAAEYDVEGTLRRLEVRRHPDLPQVLLDRGLDGFRYFVEGVTGFVKPAPLMPCPGKDLVECLPKSGAAGS